MREKLANDGGSAASTIPITLSALQNEVFLPVVSVADGAGRQACTGGALRVVVLPLTPQACRCGSTVSAPDTPESQQPPKVAILLSYRNSLSRATAWLVPVPLSRGTE